LQTCFTIYNWHTKSLSIRLELFISPKLVLRMSSIFSRNKLMIPIVLFQSLWIFFLWLVFTSNLNSQITWLRSSFNSSTCGTAARAEAARATTPQADSIDADKEEGNRDTPDTGPWRSIKTRKPPIACLWTGSQTCVRSGGWLVEVASQQALLFLISPVVILCCDLALACS